MASAVCSPTLEDRTVNVDQYFGHYTEFYQIVAVSTIFFKRGKSAFHFFRIGITQVDSVIETVLVGIKSLGEIGLTRRNITEKIGADLKDVATEALVLRVGYLVCLVLIYNKDVVIAHVVDLTADEEVFSA